MKNTSCDFNFSDQLSRMGPPFLELLTRNTLLGLLFALMIFSGHNLDFRKIDPANTGPTVMFFAIAVTFIYAYYESNEQFIDKSFVTITAISNISKRRAALPLAWHRVPSMWLILTWRKRGRAVPELVLSQFALMASLTLMMISALFTIEKMLK